ncbi:MAG TPA: ROK family protein [Caproiciproducens sp.]|nr:ROK family protein [Caproiciproducens sp.]
MATAGELKNINRSVIRQKICSKGTMSKNELAKETGLSFPTISRAVDSLVATGELLEKGIGNSTGGRCAKLYAVNPLFRVILSFSLEANEIQWFVSDLAENCIERGRELCSSDILENIGALILRIQARYPQLGAVVMGIASIVRNGVVMESFGYSELRGVNLSAYLHHISGLPSLAEEDMKIVATGFWARCSPPNKAPVCIYLGKMGIGGCIVLNGHPWHGTSSFAGEIQYLPIEHNLEYAKTHFKDADLVDYYSRVIRSYIALLNPDRIVLYQNELINGKVDAIRKESEKNFPPSVIPPIELSYEFEEDYRKGLFVFGNRLLD